MGLLNTILSVVGFGSGDEQDSTEEIEESFESKKRRFAKEFVDRRVNQPPTSSTGTTGKVTGYEHVNVADEPDEQDYRLLVTVETNKFGPVQLILNPPEKGRGFSQLHQFMEAMGATSVEALDEVLGKKVEVGLDSNGTVTVFWRTGPIEEKVYENVSDEAEEPLKDLEDGEEEQSADDSSEGNDAQEGESGPEDGPDEAEKAADDEAADDSGSDGGEEETADDAADDDVDVPDPNTN